MRVIQQWHPWLWWPRLLPQTFPVVDLVLSFLQTVSLHPAAVPSLSLLSKPYIPAPNPTSASANTRLRLRPEGSGTYHLHRSYAVLPAIDGLPPSPLSPQSSSSVPDDLPTDEGASPVAGSFPFLQLPPEVQDFIPFPCFYVPFFCPTWLCGHFSCGFRCPRSSASVQQVLCENSSVSRCILFLLISFWLCWVFTAARPLL